MPEPKQNETVIDAPGVPSSLLPSAPPAKALVHDLPILGKSAAMARVMHLVTKVAPTDSNVLITGETGTGKELIARSIHALSPRRVGPFVAVNTGSITESLQESELFGHCKGSFTGAVADRAGLFEEAEGGTLFLDEIGDTSLVLQVKLLRALENRRIRRVGESHERPVNVRLVAATHRDLSSMVRRGEFREDLFFRLNVINLQLPPLRDRGSDLSLFIDHFTKIFTRRLGKNVKSFSQPARERLQDYHFPGNIRELENIVHHCVLVADGELIEIADLPPYLRDPVGLPEGGGSGNVIDTEGEIIAAGSSARLELGESFMTISEMEKKLIEATLDRVRGNQSLAARKLGISRSTLWRKMKEQGIRV